MFHAFLTHFLCIYYALSMHVLCMSYAFIMHLLCTCYTLLKVHRKYTETKQQCIGKLWNLSRKVPVKSSWAFHGNKPATSQQAETPTRKTRHKHIYEHYMENAWKLHGKQWNLSRKVPVESSWEFNGKKPATTQQVKKRQPWKLHGACMETFLQNRGN